MFPRRLLLRLHIWTGLTAGLVLSYVALSGAAMVFRQQFDPARRRGPVAIAPGARRLALDELVRDAVAFHHSSRPDFIRYGDTVDKPVLVHFADRELAFLDPTTGAVLHDEIRHTRLFAAIEQIHRFQFIPAGDLIAGTCALTAILMIATGACLVWPRTFRAFAAIFALGRGRSERFPYLRAHKAVGICVGAIVLTSAATGLPQAFDWARLGIYRLTGSPPAVIPVGSTGADRPWLPMERFAQIAERAVPRAQLTTIHLPVKGLVSCVIIGPDAPNPNAGTLLYLDAVTGAEVGFSPYAQSSLGYKIGSWLLSVHVGQVGGMAGQLVLFLGAVGAPTLFVTGVASYFRRNRPASATQ